MLKCGKKHEELRKWWTPSGPPRERLLSIFFERIAWHIPTNSCVTDRCVTLNRFAVLLRLYRADQRVAVASESVCRRWARRVCKALFFIASMCVVCVAFHIFVRSFCCECNCCRLRRSVMSDLLRLSDEKSPENPQPPAYSISWILVNHLSRIDLSRGDMRRSAVASLRWSRNFRVFSSFIVHFTVDIVR